MERPIFLSIATGRLSSSLRRAREDARSEVVVLPFFGLLPRIDDYLSSSSVNSQTLHPPRKIIMLFLLNVNQRKPLLGYLKER